MNNLENICGWKVLVEKGKDYLKKPLFICAITVMALIPLVVAIINQIK